MNEFRQEYLPTLTQFLLNPILKNGAVIYFAFYLFFSIF